MSINENSSSDLLEAEAQSWNHIFSFINSSAAKCAVELGIPDVLYSHGNPMCLSQLSASLPLNPSKLTFFPILMRFLVNSGFLNQHEQDHYSLTPSSEFLAKNHPFSMRSFFLVNHDPLLLKTWSYLSDWFKNDSSSTTPFHTAHHKPAMDYLAEEPRLADMFNDSMASDSRLIANILITEYKHVFMGLTSLVDVGGGTGTLGIAIANAFPTIKCTILDLPHVIGNIKGSGNLEFVGGSMFDEIPKANAILLKWILHNWSDEDCVKILKKCRESIPNGGKVIIIDMVLENPKPKNDMVQAQYNMDLLMMAIYATRQRTENEWKKLFTQAGFTQYKIITSALGPRSLIEIS